MILEAFRYTKQEGKQGEWALEGYDGKMIRFSNMNLIVGKNATGKSRTLGIIREIAELLSLKKAVKDLKFRNNLYHLVFDDDDSKLEYILRIEEDVVVDEIININKECRLDRKEGKIYSEETKALERITLESSQISITKHKEKKYTFLDKLFFWGDTLNKANFTNQVEKKRLVHDLDDFENTLNNDFQDPKDLLKMVYQAQRIYGKNFNEKIIKDMKMLDYSISSINIEKNKHGFGLSVQEDELDERTNQLDMSQGMFRALSFIIRLNYSILNDVSICILIDDLGEGLDFDRARSLIALVTKKVKNSNVQLFLTTNDRYVMNAIPIQYWSVIERQKSRSVYYNYYNSKKNFDDFKFTGLSNVDFFVTQFYLSGFEESQDN